MSNWPKISSYFLQESFDLEKNLLFKDGPQYMGHEHMIPKENDYMVLPHQNDRYALFNHGDKKAIVSNACPHRQAKLLTGSGNTKNISCKLHCWTFSNKGELKGTPHFTDKVEANLKIEELHSWNHLLFKNRAPICDLKKAQLENLVNFDDYFYAGTETEHYDFNWKSFVEIYLENYHVFSMHPGLKKFVTPSDLEWIFGEDFSIQKVGIGKDLNSSGTPIYKEWQEEVIRQSDGSLPRYGAIWMYLYPNIMVEWYPNILVVSTIYPTGARTCVNHVEFYYPKALFEENSQYFQRQKEAYMETAVEDNEACLLLEDGRKALFDNGEEEYGPVDSFLEAGVQHFYDWYHKKMNA